MIFFGLVITIVILTFLRFFILIRILNDMSAVPEREMTFERPIEQPKREKKKSRKEKEERKRRVRDADEAGIFSRFRQKKQKRERERELKRLDFDTELGLEDIEIEDIEDFSLDKKTFNERYGREEERDLSELENITINFKGREKKEGRISEKYPDLFGLDEEDQEVREEDLFGERESRKENRMNKKEEREMSEGNRGRRREPELDLDEDFFETSYKGISDSTRESGGIKDALDDLNRAEKEAGSLSAFDFDNYFKENKLREEPEEAEEDEIDDFLSIFGGGGLGRDHEDFQEINKTEDFEELAPKENASVEKDREKNEKVKKPKFLENKPEKDSSDDDMEKILERFHKLQENIDRFDD